MKEPRQRLAFPRCLVSGVPAPGQGEARLHHRPSLPSHPSPRRPYLPLMLRSSLPPQSLRAWQDAPRLHLLQMDCIGGEQSTGEFSKRSCDRSPQQRRPVPSGGTSQGTLWGPGSAPKPSRQWLVPLSSLSQPWLCHFTVVSGQGPFNKCWPEDNSSIFTKKCSAAKSGLIPAANEKIRLFFDLVFFPAAEFLGKLVRGRHWSKR